MAALGFDQAAGYLQCGYPDIRAAFLGVVAAHESRDSLFEVHNGTRAEPVPPTAVPDTAVLLAEVRFLSAAGDAADPADLAVADPVLFLLSVRLSGKVCRSALWKYSFGKDVSNK
jgi:hypothetical protein